MALIPLSLRGVKFRAESAATMLRRNLLIYGLGGVIAPFVGIKLIDLLIYGPGGLVMRRQLLPASIMVVLTTVVLGLVYPLVVTGIAQVAFHDKAEGSLVKQDGKVVGSRWIGQQFTKPQYFHPRPSAAGDGLRRQPEPGLELGPDQPRSPEGRRGTRRRLPEGERSRRRREGAGRRRDRVGVGPRPPHLGRQRPHPGARAWPRRGACPSIRCSVSSKDNTDERALGFLGEPGVNVLELNLALDKLS